VNDKQVTELPDSVSYISKLATNKSQNDSSPWSRFYPGSRTWSI